MSQRKRKVQEMLSNGDGEIHEPKVAQAIKVQKSEIIGKYKYFNITINHERLCEQISDTHLIVFQLMN